MGVKRYINLPDRRRWMVYGEMEKFTIFREHAFAKGIDSRAQVVVPIEGIYGMSDEEIGQHVRTLVHDARACLAEHYAQTIVGGKKDMYRRWQEVIPFVEYVKPLLREFENYTYETAGCSEASEIPYALHIIELFEKHVERKQKGKVAKRYERGRASKNYDALFVAIGRRDGFRCAACSAVDGLQLDHIQPVTLAGETKPENLQILCQSCNAKKGEQTIDYRGTIQAEDNQ